jgi:ABC-type maltose transport system permease subunit
LKIQQFIESTFIDSNDLNRMIICGSNTLVVAIEESIYCIIISAIAALITSRLKNRIAIAKWIMLLNLLALLFAVATLYFAYSMQEKYLFALHFSRLIS